MQIQPAVLPLSLGLGLGLLSRAGTRLGGQGGSLPLFVPPGAALSKRPGGRMLSLGVSFHVPAACPDGALAACRAGGAVAVPEASAAGRAGLWLHEGPVCMGAGRGGCGCCVVAGRGLWCRASLQLRQLGGRGLPGCQASVQLVVDLQDQGHGCAAHVQVDEALQAQISAPCWHPWHAGVGALQPFEGQACAGQNGWSKSTGAE